MRGIHLNLVHNCCKLSKHFISLWQHVSKKKLCARNDITIQGVESGKFKLEIMNTKCQSEFTACIGRGFLFRIFFISGLPEPYS